MREVQEGLKSENLEKEFGVVKDFGDLEAKAVGHCSCGCSGAGAGQGA